MTTWIKVDKTQNGYTVDPDATPATADLENNHETTINVSTYTDPVEITPAQGKDGMKKTTVTLSNIPEVETTKQVTIDVSAYNPANKPVITPTAGKQSMAEVEVTLDNIPSGGSVTAYAWKVGNTYSYMNFGVAPDELGDDALELGIYTDYHIEVSPLTDIIDMSYEKLSDTSFQLTGSSSSQTYIRDSSMDVTIW